MKWYRWQFRPNPKPMTTPSKPDKPADVSLAAKEVKVVGENVVVEGQDATTKQKELAAVAGLAAKAVGVEDDKKARALEDAADERKEERQEEAVERKDIRASEERTATDIRVKEFRKTILVILLAAIPTTLAASAGAYISYRDSIVNVSTHKLVNSGSLIQLKTNLRSAQRIYMLTMDPEDHQDVVEAEKLIEEHIAKQKLADAAGT